MIEPFDVDVAQSERFPVLGYRGAGRKSRVTGAKAASMRVSVQERRCRVGVSGCACDWLCRNAVSGECPTWRQTVKLGLVSTAVLR
jgi:hypothetical protein